ncbi:hypothetical protein HKBW3S33_02324 [Candidatus Hakubella thermalkaliphila]|uniref:Uncharacterized protein n=1 Tax=Candidatus Hakubella thermalkaliphila TaxID=2754717 RepID=A0A6V8P9G1_9ACTN|nr:hypothetical protein HKBW3S33_02324 [Candidatus Hakubella thermalkaliphila]
MPSSFCLPPCGDGWTSIIWPDSRGRWPFFILGCGLTVFLVLSIYYFVLLGISLAIPVVVIVVLIYSFLLNLERGDFTDAALTVMGGTIFPSHLLPDSVTSFRERCLPGDPGPGSHLDK